jgi:hypothetical protein
VCVCVCACVCVRVCVCVLCLCIHPSTHICTRINDTRTHTHTRIEYTHTHTHTHTRARPSFAEMWCRFTEVLTALLSPSPAEPLALACPRHPPTRTTPVARRSQPGSACAADASARPRHADAPIRPDLATSFQDSPTSVHDRATSLQDSAAPACAAAAHLDAPPPHDCAEADAELELTGCEPAVSALFGCASLQVPGPAAPAPRERASERGIYKRGI